MKTVFRMLCTPVLAPVLFLLLLVLEWPRHEHR